MWFEKESVGLIEIGILKMLCRENFRIKIDILNNKAREEI